MDLIPSGMMNATLESYMIRITSRSRVIYWIIIGLIISGLAIVPFIYVDVTVTAKGVFEPDELLKTVPDLQEESPAGLTAVCYIKPGDIGLVEKSQKVEIEVDALRKEDWGILGASIADISNELITDNTSAYFRVACIPVSGFMQLSNGLKAELKSGMSFTAKVFVTRRSLFNLIFDNAGDWSEKISDKKDSKI